MHHILPHLSPTDLLKFFNLEPLNRLARKGKLKVGTSSELEQLSLSDYLSTIPRKFLYDTKYIQHYHNTALKIANKLVLEGLLSPVGNGRGIYQKYTGNGFDGNKAQKGYYDFLIYGFTEIIDYFKDAIRVLEVKDIGSKEINVGTCFAILHGQNKQYLITAKHCLPENNEIRIKLFLGFGEGYSYPQKIYVHKDDNVDIAVMEFSDKMLLSDRFFGLETPYLLDDILVSGYPPVPGTTDAILVSSKGEITAIGKSYFHKYEQIYVNANIKAGSSGSPIINSTGSVIGIVFESARDVKNSDLPDELRFGTGLTSTLINDIILSINTKDGTLHKELKFMPNPDNSFTMLG
ncbi:trypsin-like peptidase [Flavobacterium araucananum]|uniref:Serine protease n=1 Tax=Flavobacterium araucananum TaxID=946678 RepID=A0A227P5W9_9FLAO|nr:serine protease [Flavobacterium araucananum]OXG05102.1 hypothetical protein B0A64_13820 [Flavobacterium araucananum]PWJ96819.1 trypsin-like peptidase [Flavobacterium araucananum]